ncbi:hypothetical protein BFZC1_17384 [Lysinibacillus fusiformis ZC1]|nr:hypothetical protein BFZC1_17384 [Lysinibacillus fusiformis ZC1]
MADLQEGFVLVKDLYVENCMLMIKVRENFLK